MERNFPPFPPSPDETLIVICHVLEADVIVLCEL